MKCPVCHSYDQSEIDLRLDGFREGIVECGQCGTVWSVNHNLVEIVKDAQESSFLSVKSELVEGDDYCYAVA